MEGHIGTVSWKEDRNPENLDYQNTRCSIYSKKAVSNGSTVFSYPQKLSYSIFHSLKYDRLDAMIKIVNLQTMMSSYRLIFFFKAIERWLISKLLQLSEHHCRQGARYNWKR